LQKYDFPCLRYISSAAQFLPIKFIEYLKNNLSPDLKIYSMYGLTECKSVSCMNPDEILKKPTSVGKPLPNIEVYIVNENGEKIGIPGTGELVVRGSNVMMGYLNDPEETSKKLKEGIYPSQKVLYTGDSFKIDSNGYLYFIGRKDELINTGGIRVSPKEIEDVLYGMEGVLEAAVFSVSHEILGEAIKAVVSLKRNETLTEQDIISHCSNHLEQARIPRYVDIRKNLPKTPSGKIDKNKLKLE